MQTVRHRTSWIQAVCAIGPVVAFLCLVAWPVAGQQPEAPTAQAPTWVVGDSWVFRGTANRPGTFTVTAVDADAYSVREDNDGRSSLVRISRTLEIEPPYSHRTYFMWPLRVGATWSYQFHGATFTGSDRYTVTTYERVTVPAGTFDAFRIAVRECATERPSVCVGLTIWYAPTVKWYVKVAMDKSGNWVEAMRGKIVEFLSYAVTPAP